MRKQVDSYSMLIVVRYLQTKQDLVNVVMTNSKFEETLEKLHYNPIPLTPKTIELFPKLETAHYYSREETKMLKRCERKVFWYEVGFSEQQKNEYYKYNNVVLRCTNEDIEYLKTFVKDETLTIPATIKSIDQNVLRNVTQRTSVKKIVFPASMTKINNFVLNGCQFQEIVLPPSLTSIENLGLNSVHNCSKITLPEMITTIPNSFLMNCQIKELILPSSIVSIEQHAFENTPIKTIVLNEGLTRLGMFCFSNCKQLEYIKLPQTLKHLEMGAFYNCEKLKAITLPREMISVGEDCFRNCKNLTRVAMKSDFKGLTFGVFKGCDKLPDITFN